MCVCEDDGTSFASVLFYGHEVTLLIFEVLIFGLVDLAFHSYFLDAAVTFLVMQASSFRCRLLQFLFNRRCCIKCGILWYCYLP